MVIRRGTMLTLYGETDETNTSGTFTLKNEWFASDVTFIRVDRGIVAKLWGFEVGGGAVTVKIEITEDITAESPTWTTIKTIDLTSAGQIAEDWKKPFIIVTGKSGKEAFRVTWEQSTAALSRVSLIVEFAEVE